MSKTQIELIRVSAAVKGAIVMLLDVLVIVAAWFMGLWFRTDFHLSMIDPIHLQNFFRYIPLWSLACAGMIALMRGYRSIWAFVSVPDLRRVFYAYLLMTVVGLVVLPLDGAFLPRSSMIVGHLFSLFGVMVVHCSYRALLAFLAQLNSVAGSKYTENVMVIGAGDAGRALVNEYMSSSMVTGYVACVIDDNPAKLGRLLCGVPVVGGRQAIPEMVKRYHITKIIFAIPTADAQTRKDILSICSQTTCEVQVLPGIYQMINGEVSTSSLRSVDPQDLLGRDPIAINQEEIFSFISGKTVLITGGGGSIGSELCRQIAKAQPKKLVIVDIYENNAYDIQQELRREMPELELHVLIGSVRNLDRMRSILDTHRPDLVFHAAAHKHVPLMEDSPNEAIKNNVFGTLNMARASAEYGVKRFVLISTDKAVNPTNIMGASKRLCEMVVQMMNRKTKTEFVAVRFGNVLGSNGSVIPLFKKQIEEGGPVTVTHPDIIRYFMTIPEAVSLVLQAGYYAKGGEIFVLDMGEPVKIDTMARNLIRLSGYEPDVDIAVEYTGLRPGEKLYEELLMQEEGLQETANKLIHVGKPIDMDDEAFLLQLKDLQDACEGESDHIKEIVAGIVPTYKMAPVAV